MIVYLTSSHVGEYRGTEPLTYKGFNPKNGLAENLRKDWKEGNCLMIASSPKNFPINDYFKDELKQIILDTGLSCNKVDVLDERNEALADRLNDYDFLFLCGGHVPTQNEFLQKLDLRSRLQKYCGTVLGVSAGSMNAANLVYAQPEEEGETGSSYNRWLKGLNLTKINVLPHYQAVKNDVLDGKRVFEDITYPDSYGKCFVAIPDGSYIRIEKGKARLYGEATLISDGNLQNIENTTL